MIYFHYQFTVAIWRECSLKCPHHSERILAVEGTPHVKHGQKDEASRIDAKILTSLVTHDWRTHTVRNANHGYWRAGRNRRLAKTAGYPNLIVLCKGSVPLAR